MPSFKPKTSKKIKMSKISTTTLDGKHSEMVEEFRKDEDDRIPLLKQERDNLRQQLATNTISVNNDENCVMVPLTIEQKMDIKDRIGELTQEIKNIKARKKEYYLDNSRYIFDYFESKKNISSGEVQNIECIF